MRRNKLLQDSRFFSLDTPKELFKRYLTLNLRYFNLPPLLPLKRYVTISSGPPHAIA